MASVTIKGESKKAIYAKYGIEYKNGKIFSPIGLIPELLKEGNEKTGKQVYTWSILPGTDFYKFELDGKTLYVKGTCICDCVGCYAKSGRCAMQNCVTSYAKNTYLVNNHIDFVKKAIMAQLESIGRGEIRIHATGDFNTVNPDGYTKMWHDIASNFNSFRFWTYTKIKKFESLFDDLKNANIVKSVIPHMGVNFGHCDYIINAYYTLKNAGCKVYICECGIDKNKHCERCGVCATYDYVLFVEHSTGYNAEKDPMFFKLCELVKNQ